MPLVQSTFEFTIAPTSFRSAPCILPVAEYKERPRDDGRCRPKGGHALEQRKTDAEVALELMRMVLEQAGSRRLSPTRTLALYHLCKEAVAYAPEGKVTADYLEDQLRNLLQ